MSEEEQTLPKIIVVEVGGIVQDVYTLNTFETSQVLVISLDSKADVQESHSHRTSIGMHNFTSLKDLENLFEYIRKEWL